MAVKLGTWTTFDCPTEKVDEAIDWLDEQFKVIGGRVRKVMNRHDFMDYPSFEIDIPEKYGMSGDDDENEAIGEARDAWIVKANEIEDAYSDKFGEWL